VNSAGSDVVHEAPPHEGQAVTAKPLSRPRRPEMGLVIGLARRDLMRLRKDTARWIGLVLQPLLLWALLGSGLAEVFTVPGRPDVDYHRYFFPGLVVMIGLFTAIFATMAVIEDRDHGFLQQVLVAPGSRTSMVFGKVLGVLFIALVQFALVVPAATIAGYDLGAISWGLLLLGYVLGVITLTGFAFALAWVSRTASGYHAVMGVLLIPLWLVSGAVFPLPNHGFLGVIGFVDPMTYMVDAMRHGFEGGSADLAFTSPLISFVVLAALAGFAVMLAAFVARRPVGGLA